LWIKRPFGVCGELWLVSGFFWASFRFIGGDLWQLEDDRGEKPTGKTWLDDGEIVVRCGRLCGAQELRLWIAEVESWRSLIQSSRSLELAENVTLQELRDYFRFARHSTATRELGVFSRGLNECQGDYALVENVIVPYGLCPVLRTHAFC
jgi:hypothetical protein